MVRAILILAAVVLTSCESAPKTLPSGVPRRLKRFLAR